MALPGGADTAAYFAGEGRFRDIAISPNGLKIYLACDISGATSGPTGGFNNKINTIAPPNAGKIVEFTFTSSANPSIARSFTPLTEKLTSANVYPNPTNGNTTLELGFDEIKSVVVEVYNIFGARVKTLRTQKGKFDIDLKPLPAGVYSLRVADLKGNLITTEKIIKQ